MIYITGDCHGDYRKLNTQNFPEQKQMTKNDYVIIAGDFGFWDESKEQKYWLDWLENKPFTTLWIDGNHENYDLLKTYPIEVWKGGKVQKLMPSVIHLMRGQVFEIDGCTIFTFGGAASHDISGGILELDDPLLNEKRKKLALQRMPYRINHFSWWKEEMPSQEEMQEGLDTLEKVNHQVNYIVTHCASSSTQNLMDASWYERDRLTDYFEEIKAKVHFKKWFFGHYHDNRKINEKEILLYEQVIRIW